LNVGLERLYGVLDVDLDGIVQVVKVNDMLIGGAAGKGEYKRRRQAKGHPMVFQALHRRIT
jgi:hypothetical protein